MFYKNISNAIKTFYGIQIKPGEIKEFPRAVNDISLIVVHNAGISPVTSVPMELPRQITADVPTKSVSLEKKSKKSKLKQIIETPAVNTKAKDVEEFNDLIKEEENNGTDYDQ